ncbi:uncharacterized protein LOC134660403 [Cydia amplana]|uniref:uncharacterized protein LOC134660403 n=1 Tax=Cydia amplana TaxID=1869771 RepID=UPI002FE58A10
MTATTTQVPTRQLVSEKEWLKLFPKHFTENYTSSVTFIKQLTVMAMSTITYMKCALPEDSYDTEQFAGLRLKLLKDKCEDEMARFLSKALKCTFEAFDKKYVHQLAICFHKGDCVPENMIEYHLFEYTYNADGVSMNISSANGNNEKNATSMLLRTLSVYESGMPPLPVDYDISLRIYYNESAPEDYQAPGFEASTGPDPVSDTLRAAVRLGRVETPYHKLVARTYMREDMPDEPSDTTEMRQDDDVEDGSMNCEVDSESLEPSLRCPCGKQDSREQALVTCRFCHTQQHATCFGLLGPITEHCCAECADRDPARRSTCSILEGLGSRKQECLCIFRRTLAMCSRQASLTGDELMARFNLTLASTAKMIRLLTSHQILANIDPNKFNLTLASTAKMIRLLTSHQILANIDPNKGADLYAQLAPPGGKVLVQNRHKHTTTGDELMARFNLTLASTAKMIRLLTSHQILANIDPNNLTVVRNINPIRLKLAYKKFFLTERDSDSIVERVIAETEASDPVGEALGPIQQITLKETNPGTVIDKPETINMNTPLKEFSEVEIPTQDPSEELPLSGSHNPVNVPRPAKRLKRKKSDEEEWTPKLPKLRSGSTRNKRA